MSLQETVKRYLDSKGKVHFCLQLVLLSRGLCGGLEDHYEWPNPLSTAEGDG